METLAKRLTWAREQKGLTQASLAKLSGVTQSTIGNLESGIRSSARRIIDIAAALDVSPAWLANGQGDPNDSTPGMPPAVDPTANYEPLPLPPKRMNFERDVDYVEDASLPNETTLERLDAREKLILELYRRASNEGKLVIYGAAKAAAEHNDLSLIGHSE